MSDWWASPYKKGKAVGPPHLPRVLRAPSKNGGELMRGFDVLAMKRAICKAGRWGEWEPTNWDQNYYEVFSMGKGTGQVADSGVRGFQRQEGITQNGVMDDATWQRLRRALVPEGPNKGRHVVDSVCISLIAKAAYEFSDEAKLAKVRVAITDFCARAEAHEGVWHYTQRRPFAGLGVSPEEPHMNDCSGYVILAYFWARKTAGILVPDPSGYRYTGYGNTWDDLDGHPRVTSGNYLVGDLANYDGHVTICKRGGDARSALWSSMGSERGPIEESLFYRGDLRFVGRPPLGVA